MATFENLAWQNEGGILHLTLNRPDKLNALNIATLQELREAFEQVYDNPEIKAVILTGSGEKAFAAGADIAEIAELNEVNARKFSENGQEIFSMIENCHKPVIALVNGFALGGGCELAMACHLRVATANAKFGQPEVNLGVIPGYGGTQRLTHLVGKGKALEWMMTGEVINAETALQHGLINYICEDKAAAMDKTKSLLQTIMAKAPIAIGLVIDCVNAAFLPDEDGYQTEANGFGNCCKSQDFKEGTTAFLEKRKANFTGE
jgi:enoyl-CoA hydratase